MHISLIAAVAKNGIIGNQGTLPWSLRSDMKFFRQTTTNKPVIMGRKTWASLKSPLANRDNIVLTRDGEFEAEGAFIVQNSGAALEMAKEFAQIRSTNEVMVMGGEEIYNLYLPEATRLYITEIDMSPEGDASFPRIDKNVWKEVSRVDHEAGKKDDAAFSFVLYER